jgi:hypothetical protein
MPLPQALIQELEKTPSGSIKAELWNKLLPALTNCWHEFEGSAASSMQAWKLDRAEDVRWTPPCLSFLIERHGQTVLGSTRATLQRWSLDLQTRKASCSDERRRQLYRPSKKLDVKAIASRVREAVQQGHLSNSELARNGVIAWASANEIQIYHGKLIPGDGFQQTVANRRRRFRNELTRMLAPLGWNFVEVRRSMVFRRIERD